MNFEHFDDPEPFVVDDDLRVSVRTEGERRRRRARRNRVGFSSFVALLLIVSILGYAAWTTTNIDRIHVGFEAEPVDLTHPFNVLLIGSDRRPGDQTMIDRADAAMVLRVDPNAARISVLSIPRDLTIEGVEGPRVAELLEGGPDTFAEAIQADLGIPLSAYVQITFEGLVAIADSFGGLDVSVTMDSADASSGLDLIPSACTSMHGEQLLAALRSRSMVAQGPGGPVRDASGDAGRRVRQRALLAILFAQAHRLAGTPGGLEELIGVALNDLKVDDRIEISTMISIARWASSTPIDVSIIDLPAEWTSAENQRRVLVMNPQSVSTVRSFNDDGGPLQSNSDTDGGAIQPFARCD